MDMSTMETDLSGWLTPLAWVFLALSLASAAAIAHDIWGRRQRHTHLAAELVWVGSALTGCSYSRKRSSSTKAAIWAR